MLKKDGVREKDTVKDTLRREALVQLSLKLFLTPRNLDYF